MSTSTELSWPSAWVTSRRWPLHSLGQQTVDHEDLLQDALVKSLPPTGHGRPEAVPDGAGTTSVIPGDVCSGAWALPALDEGAAALVGEYVGAVTLEAAHPRATAVGGE